MPWSWSRLACQQRKSTESFHWGGHSESDDMYEGGGEEHVNSDTALPSWESASQCPEEPGAGGLKVSGAYSDAPPRRSACTKQELWETWARCRAAHADMHSREKCTGWGEGRAEAGIRPDITPFKKHHSTWLCSARVAPLSWLTVV